jgi:hypothetical protein
MVIIGSQSSIAVLKIVNPVLMDLTGIPFAGSVNAPKITPAVDPMNIGILVIKGVKEIFATAVTATAMNLRTIAVNEMMTEDHLAVI